MNFKQKAQKFAVTASGTLVSASAFALDTAGVESALTSAGTTAGSVAGMVLVAVAAIAGVGVIMSLIKRV